MKKLLILTLVLLSVAGGYAQIKVPFLDIPTETDSTSFATFQGGGFEEFRLWVISKAFPEANPTKGRYQKAIVGFNVDSRGNICNAKLVIRYGIDTVYGNKIVAAVSQSPQWSPATKSGLPVNAWVTMNIWCGKFPKDEYTPTYCDVDEEIPILNNGQGSSMSNKGTGSIRMAHFPHGGESGFIRWVAQWVTDSENVSALRGEAHLKFIVEKDGSIEEIIVVSANNMKLVECAMQALKASPRWSPGMVNGKPVRVWHMVPVIVK